MLLAASRITDVDLAEMMIGKAVEHMFEKDDDGAKDEWRGMVLARAPIMTTWFYITYEKDPVLYMYQLLEDYKEGDLRIMADSSKYKENIPIIFVNNCSFPDYLLYVTQLTEATLIGCFRYNFYKDQRMIPVQI